MLHVLCVPPFHFPRSLHALTDCRSIEIFSRQKFPRPGMKTKGTAVSSHLLELMTAKSASKKAKSPEAKALNAKPRKTQKETPSKPAPPKPSVEVEESASDLENEFLEEEAHNALMENDSDDDVPHHHCSSTIF